jgi:hypothetical protein
LHAQKVKQIGADNYTANIKEGSSLKWTFYCFWPVLAEKGHQLKRT